MKASVRAFFKKIIDYAGLFPPANLSLDTSLHKYRDYRNSEHDWMLSRYIIPASRLEELKAYDEKLFGQAPPYDFSVLGAGTETAASYFENLERMVEQIRKFHSVHGSHVTSRILEVKLPREVVLSHDKDLLMEVFEETMARLNDTDEAPPAVFFEAYLEESWKKDIQHVLKMIHRYNSGQPEESATALGFKLRCGGTEASMFPTVEQLTYILNLVKDNRVPLKCTAGLHHPVRHYADSVKTKMHGFLNVFGGAMLHYEHNLSENELLQIIREEDHDHFSFTEDAFEWKDKAISVDRIQELRQHALISFGSCSFKEPREDLQEWGLL